LLAAAQTTARRGERARRRRHLQRRGLPRAAAARIEHAKRLLGVAEEMGIEFEPESLPPD
jgi:hypothetical protein